MSYLVLARKYRPQTFEEVVGQAPTVRTLRNAISRDRVAHAMIFSGVRGIGKTTLARIMAKALNCRQGPLPVPCNRCESCLGVADSTAIDLHEIDGASNRGIQEIRELKENIRFYPTRDRFKIVVIDEVHMLTTEAFNALLKTLEEPPAHVYFMFATTELHKIPITILSRCQRYELKRVPARDLFSYFRRIAEAEEVRISDWAIHQIVREAGGSVRDGLSLLDQIFSFGGDEITDEDVMQVLGLAGQEVLGSLAGAIMDGDLERSLSILADVYSYGIDLKRFAFDILDFFRSLIICRVATAPAELLELDEGDLEELGRLAAGHSPDTLQLYFQLLLKGVEEMRYASQPRLTLEMTLIRAIQASNVVPVSELLAGLDAFGGVPEAARQPAAGGNRDSRTAAVEPAESRPAEVRESGAPSRRQEAEGKKEEKASAVSPGETGDHGEDSVPEGRNALQPGYAVEHQQPPETSEPPPAGPVRKEVRQHWDGFIDYVLDRKKWMGHTLRMVESAREEDGVLVLKYNDPSDCRVLQSRENQKYLTEFAQDFFQRELKLAIRVRGGETRDADGDGDGPQEERRALAGDSLVRMATEVFGGRVVNIRTGPRSR